MPDSIRDLIGQQLQHYQVTAILDIGGEYRYLRAVDTLNHRGVMLVMLPPKVFEEQDQFAALKEECSRIQSLKQSHLLPIYHVGMWQNLPYVVVPQIRESLGNFLAREKRIAPNRAVRTVTELSWAVQTLHTAGLIHGDIQPGNLLYNEAGVLHLADFGIMRAHAREQEHLRRGHGLGTTAPLALPSPYKAPELIGPRVELSVSGDIYALGAILYEMITGTTPRNLQSSGPIQLPAESGLDPQQSNVLDTAIRRALALEPGNRFPDARAFAVALRAVSGSKTISPARNEPLTNSLAGVWHVSHGPATDASAQQLIASLFSAEEPAKVNKTAAPLPRWTPVDKPHAERSVDPDRRARWFSTRSFSKRWLVAALAVVILLLVSTVGAIAAVNGNPLQILEPGTATPQVTPIDTSPATSVATSTIRPAATSKPKAAPSATRSR